MKMPKISASKTQQKLKMLTMKDNFIKNIKEFRIKWNIPKNGFISETSYRDWSNNLEEKTTSYLNDLNLLRKKHKLSTNMNTSLATFILYNKVDRLPAGNFRLKTDINKYGEQELYIQIFAETTSEDIKNQWNIIKLHQKELTGYTDGRFKKRDKLDRDKRVVELKKLHKTNTEIAKTINKEFEEETLIPEDISQIIKRLKDVL